MRVEILGSGGATTVPRPACRCPVCVQGRERGLPYTRTGPSVFVHGPDVLFDTPEESRLQLDRAAIGRIAACVYSHWHPDHTMGRRVWETRNGDFRTWLGGMAHLEFMESRGYVRVHELADGDVLELDGVTVRPFRLVEDYVYAFELVGGGRRLLLAMDELNGWSPPAELRGCQLAVLPMGICEHHPITGERRIHPEHPILRFEATFAETLEIVDRLGAERVVLSHVEEIDGLSYDDLLLLGERLRAEGRPVTFAYDGFAVEV